MCVLQEIFGSVFLEKKWANNGVAFFCQSNVHSLKYFWLSSILTFVFQKFVQKFFNKHQQSHLFVVRLLGLSFFKNHCTTAAPQFYSSMKCSFSSNLAVVVVGVSGIEICVPPTQPFFSWLIAVFVGCFRFAIGGTASSTYINGGHFIALHSPISHPFNRHYFAQ